jgi:MerR family copper efflux transcriptional regulator
MNEEELVCTADLDGAVQEQMNEYRALFQELRGRERIPDGFRWRFPARLEARVRAQAAREAECCKFFRFTLRVEGEEVLWETRAAANAAALLDEFHRLPDHLAAEPRPGQDIARVKDAITAAGLRFGK